MNITVLMVVANSSWLPSLSHAIYLPVQFIVCVLYYVVQNLTVDNKPQERAGGQGTLSGTK